MGGSRRFRSAVWTPADSCFLRSEGELSGDHPSAHPPIQTVQVQKIQSGSCAEVDLSRSFARLVNLDDLVEMVDNLVDEMK